MNYYSVLEYSEAEHIVEKSKFVTYTKPVFNEEEAVAFIANIKKKNYNATHNVSAYIIGASSDIKRYSDDGEPSGTAGMPALDTMLKKGITNSGNTSIIFRFRKKACDLCSLFIHLIFVFVSNKFVPVSAPYPSGMALQ